MTFYSDMADMALDLITEFGQTVTIERKVNYVTDPITGVVTVGTLLSGSFTVINPPASGGTVQAFDNRLNIDDAFLKSNNLRFLIVAASDAPFEPMALDSCTLGSDVYTIAGVTPISPDGTALVYKLGIYK